MTDSAAYEQQSLIEDAARRFLVDNYSFAEHRQITEQQPGYSTHQWHQIAQLGWMLLPIKAEFDGLGGDMASIATLAKEFGRALYVSPYLSSAIVASQILQQADDHPVCKSLLARIGSGETIVAPALYEPHSRYNVTDIATTVQKSDGSLVINGTKSAVLYANVAAYFLVLAKDANQPDALSAGALYLIRADQEGIEPTHYRTHDGGRASEIKFNNVKLTDECVLLTGDKAIQSVEQALCLANAAICAELVGAMEATLEMTLEYVKTRSQFGRKLSAFQSLQHRLVDMFMRCQFAESMSREAARAIQHCDPFAREMTISAAKCDIARAALLNAEEAVQLHGAMGMMDEMPVGHYLKRIFTLSLQFGDADYHQARYRNLRLQSSS